MCHHSLILLGGGHFNLKKIKPCFGSFSDMIVWCVLVTISFLSKAQNIGNHMASANGSSRGCDADKGKKKKTKFD